MSTNHSHQSPTTLAPKEASGASSPAPRSFQPMKMSTKPKPRQVVIDPDGELSLTVGRQERVTFVVCPKTLARASPFFKRLLYGGFAESIRPDRNIEKEWNPELPEDSPEAMEIFLNIVHSRFDKIPIFVNPILWNSTTTILSYRTLYQLTVLTDKYDLTRILRPWVQNWVKDMHTNLTFVNLCSLYKKPRFIELHSWIAWELGDKTTFSNAADYFILHSITDQEGGLRLDGADSMRLFSSSLELTGLSSLVKDKRLEIIRKMLDPVKDVVARLIQGSSKSLCTGVSDHVDCEVTMLGAIVRSLTPRGLYPIPNPEDISISIVQLADKLECMDSRSRLHGHKCTALPKIAIKTLKKANPQLAELHLKHLKAQAEKTGLGS
ncbi:hypothetical protein F5Y06DRAFT_305218 [Hypoxylon sp. FL0890]|nr:hypothetical protein F5Y06DRAFT_305218 [Hypoxylon sp. FL0890]